MAKMTQQEIAKIKQEAIAFHKAQACSTEQAAVFAEAAVRDALENSAPDLGNTRINGTSEGLRRGARLTGRINRAISIGEEVTRQNGAAFDSHLRNADSPKCAGCGTALSGRGDVWDSYSTGKDWCRECDGTKAAASVRQNAAFDRHTRRNAAGNLKGAHWAKEEKKNSLERVCDFCHVGKLKEQPGGDDEKGRKFKCDSCGKAMTVPGRENAAPVFKPGDKVRHKKDRTLVGRVESVRGDTVTVDWERSENLRYGAITPEAEEELELANASDSPAGVIYKSLDVIKKQIAECKEDLALYEKQGKDREARAMRADIKELEADYAHDAPLWEKHNAGDEGFLGAGSGIDTDAEQAQQGLGPAEDKDVLWNSGVGLKRGAGKYGSRENAPSPRFKIGDVVKAHGEKAKVVGVNDQNKYGGKDHSYEVQKPDGVREVWWEGEVSSGIF